MTADPLCGATGNETFFDYNNNSAPQAAYNQLLSRGWKPIAAANWNLPAFAIFNPCTTGNVPVISNFRIEDNTEGIVVLSWNTDIPASSQVLYTRVSTGEEVLTTADNRLRLVHRVVIAGQLQSGQAYDFNAVSISADFGKAISAPLRATVQ